MGYLWFPQFHNILSFLLSSHPHDDKEAPCESHSPSNDYTFSFSPLFIRHIRRIFYVEPVSLSLFLSPDGFFRARQKGRRLTPPVAVAPTHAFRESEKIRSNFSFALSASLQPTSSLTIKISHTTKANFPIDNSFSFCLLLRCLSLIRSLS